MTDLRGHLELSEKPTEAGISQTSSGLWVLFTFVAAFTLNIASSSVMWIPNFVGLAVVFWTFRQPETVGMAVAFLCGIFIDAVNGAVLGQHALGLITLSYFTTILSRRLQLFAPAGQALHILPLLLISQLLVMLVRLWLDGLWPGWEWFLQSFSSALIWPLWIRFMQPHFLSQHVS